MHIKISRNNKKRSILTLLGLTLLALSLPLPARAQNNPFQNAPAPTQQQTTQAQVDAARKDKEKFVDSADKNAANSQYCNAYYISWNVNQTSYSRSDLKACVDGVVQKVAGVDAADSCMNYHSTTSIGQSNPQLYQICKNSFSATPKGASTATLIGGHDSNTVKQNAQAASQAAAAASSGGSQKDQVDCDANESPLSWIACPLIDAGAGMTDYVFNNFVQPLLQNVPVSSNKDDGAFVAWQTFRIFGNAILVGALLVMVFAQNMGRFVDAYTVRKMAPRIVVGAIAINISYYLCLAAIDITNIIGTGMSQILTTPFIDQNSFKGIKIDATASNNITGVLSLGLLAAAAGIVFSGGALIATTVGVLWLMMPLLVSVSLIALAVLFTIVIRQALIIFLTAVSAVAIACFILPGTEKYFRKWLDLFVKTLMVYPIIAVIFAMSNVMGSIILRTANGGVPGTAQVITAILVVYAPLALVPFAFKFAGGAIGAIYGTASNLASRGAAGISGSGFMKGRREYFGQRAADARLQNRAQQFRSLNARADRGNRLAGFAAGRLNGYRNDILAREAEMQGRKGKEFNDTISSGDDTQIRAYSANLRQADRDRANGVGEGQTWRTNAQGQLEVQSAAGKWVSRQAAVQARQAYGENNTAAYQASMAYEMRKATTQEEHDALISNFATGAAERGMTADQANGVWIGAAFANQNEDRQWKYNSWSRDDNGQFSHKVNGLGLMTEIDERQGSYASSMQNADTWTTMGQEVTRARQVVDGQIPSNAEEMQQAQETLARASRISNSLKNGSFNTANPDDEDQAGAAAAQAAAMQTRGQQMDPYASVGYGAAGRVKEEMRAFAQLADYHAGQYTPTDDIGTNAPPVGPSTPEDASNRRDANR